jgi:flagellar hook-associated protein 3 FlgL
MAITGIGSRSALAIQALGTMRAQMNDLQRQLGTGKLSTSYAGLGIGRGMSVGLRSNLTALTGYEDTITNVGVRLSITETVLSRISEIGRTVKSATQVAPFQVDGSGQTTLQKTALSQLDEMLGLLNTQSGDRFLFSGRNTDSPATAKTDLILNGNGTQAGFKQIMAERRLADIGANGLGRLLMPAITSGAAALTGAGATLIDDAPAVANGNLDLSALSSAGGNLIINGVTIAIAPGDDELTVQSAINGAGAGVTATFDGTNQLVLTSADADTAIDIDAASTVLAELGLTAGVSDPVNLLTQGAVLDGQTFDIQVGSNPPNAPLAIVFGDDDLAGEISTLAELNAALGTLAGATAAVDSTGNITITAGNTDDAIVITGSASAAAFGLAATTAAPSNAVALTEDSAIAHPFGFKLADISTTMTAATVTGPAGAPPAVSVDFSGLPTPGQDVRVTFTLPDGSSETLTLIATASTNPAKGEFTIGATPSATAANFNATLNASVTSLAKSALTAASAVAASHDFFDLDVGQPPMRVAGPPFDSATTLVAGTPADTVSWYTGEMGTDSARGTAVARIDQSLTVAYGVRANEEAIRYAVQHVAVFASMTFSATDPDANDAFLAMNRRLSSALDGPNGTQRIDDIEAELAGAHTTIQAADERHAQTRMTLENMLSGIEDAPKEEVAAQILAMQTNLEAALRTTAILYQISIVDYL